MGKITILNETTKNPLSLMGECAGYCWNSNTKQDNLNIKRAIECIENEHGRVLEYPTICFILEGYSAKVIREYYTHIGDNPTRLQASTRYIDYGEFEFITPPKIACNKEAVKIYNTAMENISKAIQDLSAMNIPKEDSNMLLPLAMTTKVVVKTNLRALIHMFHKRTCTRAYWEFRKLMKDLYHALENYSSQWKEICKNYFKTQCDFYGFCPEKYTCGRHPSKEIVKNIQTIQQTADNLFPDKNTVLIVPTANEKPVKIVYSNN